MPQPVQLTESRLRHELARVAAWYKVNKKGEEVPAHPPLPVVQDILARPDLDLPILSGIVTAPIFGGDGSLHTKAGYHGASRLYYAPAEGFAVPPVSTHPTDAELAQARALIVDELFADFPFTGEPERAHAVALLLLPFVRPLIDGATPLHLVEKPSPGTGATLLIDSIATIATGFGASIMTEGGREDEWGKLITAKLRASAQL
ncbi:ATPase, partial (plasmid) [Azospirillum brasilense]